MTPNNCKKAELGYPEKPCLTGGGAENREVNKDAISGLLDSRQKRLIQTSA